MHNNPSKFKTTTKLYWAVWASSALVMGILALLGWYSLSFGDANERFVNYYYYSRILFYANLFSFFLLLALSAYKQKSSKQSLFYIPTYLLFAVFTFILYSLLNEKEFHLRQLYDLDDGGFSMNHVYSTLLSVIGVLIAVVIYVGVLMTNRKR